MNNARLNSNRNNAFEEEYVGGNMGDKSSVLLDKPKMEHLDPAKIKKNNKKLAPWVLLALVVSGVILCIIFRTHLHNPLALKITAPLTGVFGTTALISWGSIGIYHYNETRRQALHDTVDEKPPNPPPNDIEPFESEDST